MQKGTDDTCLSVGEFVRGSIRRAMNTSCSYPISHRVREQIINSIWSPVWDNVMGGVWCPVMDFNNKRSRDDNIQN